MPDATTQKKSIWADCGLQSLVAIVLIIVLTAALLWAQAGVPTSQGGGPADLSKILSALIAVILGLFAAVVLAKMICGPIDLSKLVSEDNGSASMSRFQFLIFTFVIAASYLVLAFKATDLTKLVDIPANVLGLIGISGGSYVASKVVQKAADTSQANAAANAAPNAAPQAPANPPAAN
jgi:p-aminobenzoyl-glutamate transporter AbgT